MNEALAALRRQVVKPLLEREKQAIRAGLKKQIKDSLGWDACYVGNIRNSQTARCTCVFEFLTEGGGHDFVFVNAASEYSGELFQFHKYFSRFSSFTRANNTSQL